MSEGNVAPFQIFLLFRQAPVGDGYVLDVSIEAHMNRGALHKTGGHYTKQGGTTQNREALHKTGRHYTKQGGTTQNREALHKTGRHYTKQNSYY